MRQALEGVTVLDLSHALAGPFCSMMLGDHGANVIKIEPPGAGDISRAWGSRGTKGEAGYFISLHRNKRGIVLDLKNPQGKETFLRLVERADIVLENYRVGALDKLGLGYEAARARNAGVIYCSISGFGQDGPYRDRAALDLILQAESGMISVTGSAEGATARAGVSIADMTAGMNAAFAILAALRVKEKTGLGQQVDISMLEGQLALLSTMIGDYFMDGSVPRPMGTAYRSLLPYQTFIPGPAISHSRSAAKNSGRSSALRSAAPSSRMIRVIAPIRTAARTGRVCWRDCRTCFSRGPSRSGRRCCSRTAFPSARSTTLHRWSSTRRSRHAGHSSM